MQSSSSSLLSDWFDWATRSRALRVSTTRTDDPFDDPSIDALRRSWVEWVSSFDVELRPGGRAILRAPGATFRVEVDWIYDRRQKTHVPQQFSVIGEEGPADLAAMRSLEPDDYFAALRLAMETTGVGNFSHRVPRRRPQPGAPLDTGFYRSVLGAYDQLLAEGHKAPAKELARRMDANPNTVKSWLRRARRQRSETD